MNILNDSLEGNLHQILLSLDIKSSHYIFDSNVYDLKKMKKSKNDPKQKTSNLLLESIQQTFYTVLHCRNMNFLNEKLIFNYNIMREFVEVLSEANRSKGRWETGWRIMEIMDKGNTIKVKNDNVDIVLYQNINQFKMPDGNLEVGKIGSILMPKEMRQMSIGFYSLVGDASDNDPNDITVRVYWNINAAGAKILLKHITTELNTDNIPFQFKTLSNPFDYKRTDAAVLYIKKKYFENCLKKMDKIYNEIKNFIKPDTSLFVKKIYPGIGIAEDIGGNESFGENRARIFAEAILASRDKFGDTKDIDKHREYIISYFQNLGINIKKPYLNDKSKDIYDQILYDQE